MQRFQDLMKPELLSWVAYTSGGAGPGEGESPALHESLNPELMKLIMYVKHCCVVVLPQCGRLWLVVGSG